MKLNFVAVIVIAGFLAGAAGASERQYQLSDGRSDVLHGQLVGAGKAARDTTYLLGGPGRLDGKFQDAAGNPDWHGWTHVDATDQGLVRWHVSDFHSPTGTPALWCGQEGFDNACGSGYGNDWEENLVFAHTVADPGVPTVVHLQGVFNCDSEPGFDYLRVQCLRGDTWQDIVPAFDGIHTSVVIDETITFLPGDYVGPDGDQVQLRLQGTSDGAWSDEDCLFDTDGLAQVDDLRVTVGTETFIDDFDDGSSQHWFEVEPPAVGDFATIWRNLLDLDTCMSNSSAQVAFIDDGNVVPGTGGTPCITWCYGPGGYIVNNTGGLAGPDDHLNNLLLSPALEWPAGNDGAILTFDVYQHEELLAGVSPGIFYGWHVRSVATGDPADLAAAPWEDRDFGYYGPHGYRSLVHPLTGLLVPGRTHVQIGLRCLEYGWVFGYEGNDGTPAPYFDNVAFKVFPYEGPSIAARDIDLAQDDFPDRGTIDLVNLANNWVRFDMARSISPDAHLRNDPGDSIFVDLGLPRAGSVLNQMPKLVVKMKANPLFDGVRVLPANFAQAGNIIDGWVYGDSTRRANGTIVADRYNFDLPDSSFFFPGDVIHYYIEAQDNLGGDVRTAHLPADTSGFGEFAGIFPYGGNSTFIVRALPTLINQAGDQPEILFWNDFANRGGENEWYFALRSLVLTAGRDYDMYYTNGPSSGVGNGLGGRATSQTIGGYDTLLYTAGDLGVNTIANNDYSNDPSNDIGVLDSWFQQGGKHAFLTGDDLVFNLSNSGGAALTFRNAYLGTHLVNNNLLPLIHNQTAPTVVPLAGNSVFTSPQEWIAFGGCLGINDFDAIEPIGTTERLAQFLTPGGDPGYSYAAATRYTNVADVIVMPYDFMFLHNSQQYVPGRPGFTVRAEVLGEILIEFGHIPPGDMGMDVPGSDQVLGVSSYPNPFNPRTTIRLDLPRAGDVALKVFDIRGRLVRTLHEGRLTEGRHDLIWNGDDDAGRALASGVYFYEVKATGQERIGKLTLVR